MIRAHKEEADVFVSTVWNVPKAQAHQNDLNDDLWGIYRMLVRILYFFKADPLGTTGTL